MRSVFAGFALAAAVFAQQNQPHIGYVYPAGARQSTVTEITVGGQFLDEANNVYITGNGVQALITKVNKLMTQQQFQKLRDQVDELNEKRKKEKLTEAEEKIIADARIQMATFVRRPATPAVAERLTVRVQLAADAVPGMRELRIATPNGLTNPMVFEVGQLPEFSKEPARPIDEQVAQGVRFGGQAPTNVRSAPLNVTLPAIVNGQVMPGAIDVIRFRARQGQKLVVAAAARELIPYISDAVPGWFQATLTLLGPQGKEVEYADHFRFHPDPVLYYEIATDGEYTLEVHDSIYRGREDFVYRITLGEVPYLTSLYPLGGKAGAKTQVEVRGWNLPASRVTENTKQAGVRLVSVNGSNALPYVVDALPEKTEKEPNNQVKGAPSVKLPVMINGRIDRPGDVDVFRFDGKAGQEIVAEIFARRLESPLDSLLRITDASGKQLAVNDDFEDKGMGLLTHQADSRILFTIPKNGSYYVHVSDTQRQGGPEFAYRLRLAKPQPDFDLRMVPASVNLRPGMTTAVTVYALRRDGFDGDISLHLKNAPQGFELSGAVIPAGQEKVRLTLTVPVSRIEKPRPMGLEGRAPINGKEVKRAGQPAEDMMQAFFYHHLVTSKDWMVRVSGDARPMPALKVNTAAAVRIPAGGTAQVQVFVPNNRVAEQLRLKLNDPPEGLAIQSVRVQREGVLVTLRADAKAKAGLRSNLIVDAAIESAQRRRQPIGILPAIPFEVTGVITAASTGK